MATVTNTDFVFDASGLGNSDPYTITGVTEIDAAANDVQILNGGLTSSLGQSGTDVDFRLRKNGTATASTLRSSAEADGAGSYNKVGVCMLASDGAGIGMFVSFGGFFSVYEWNASGVIGTTHFLDEEPTTVADGERIHMEYDTATGVMRFYKESTQLTTLNLTDTSFTSTAMMPGWAMFGGDADMAMFVSIGADYLSGGGGGGTQSIVTAHPQRNRRTVGRRM